MDGFTNIFRLSEQMLNVGIVHSKAYNGSQSSTAFRSGPPPQMINSRPQVD